MSEWTWIWILIGYGIAWVLALILGSMRWMRHADYIEHSDIPVHWKNFTLVVEVVLLPIIYIALIFLEVGKATKRVSGYYISVVLAICLSKTFLTNIPSVQSSIDGTTLKRLAKDYVACQGSRYPKTDALGIFLQAFYNEPIGETTIIAIDRREAGDKIRSAFDELLGSGYSEEVSKMMVDALINPKTKWLPRPEISFINASHPVASFLVFMAIAQKIKRARISLIKEIKAEVMG